MPSTPTPTKWTWAPMTVENYEPLYSSSQRKRVRENAEEDYSPSRQGQSRHSVCRQLSWTSPETPQSHERGVVEYRGGGHQDSNSERVNPQTPPRKIPPRRDSAMSPGTPCRIDSVMGSSDLSDPPSGDSDVEDQLSTAVPSSRPSVDITHTDLDHLAPPSKKRKTGPSTLATFDRAPSSQPPEDDDNISLSSDGYSSAPGSPSQNEYAMRDEAQVECLWRDCDFGQARNNDELVTHVQTTHCATGGPKKTKYTCEWGECQKKQSNHPSGYALKAHMRSHTKEKPYYCALPECDKAFTRSDALAKHMRTVHEPEPARTTTAATNDPTPPGKKSIKLKLTNGSSHTTTTTTTDTKSNAPDFNPNPAPTHDEDGNPIPNPSPANDNISYTPAHHPVTGQPGYMITYPPDVHFTAWESAIAADQLMRLLRRQLHWARQEGEAMNVECEALERMRREEWNLKEILLDSVLEEEVQRARREGLLNGFDNDLGGRSSKEGIDWLPPPIDLEEDTGMRELRQPRQSRGDDTIQTPPAQRAPAVQHTPSPPPTGQSGGFDGDADPYDNYLAQRMAEYEERERVRSLHNTPQQTRSSELAQQTREADAVGALMGMSGGT